MPYPPTVCFWCEPTPRVQRSLRRYTEGDCPGQPGWGIHNASVVLDVVNAANEVHDGYETYPYFPSSLLPRDDPRWPTKCDHCDFHFDLQDDRTHHWQVNPDRFYRTADGREFTLHKAPPGAMWDCFWMKDRWRGPDGICLVVMLPNGVDWIVDAPPGGKSETPWQRTGTIPRVSVTPSILAGDYHSFLTDGVLGAG